MSASFKVGDRVGVNDPALAALRAIFKDATGKDTPNHHGFVDEVHGDTLIILFDDGGAAPYPAVDTFHLEDES